MAYVVFVWNERYETGWPIVDEQHRQLVELLNQLGSLYASDAHADQLMGVFDELAAYTVYHFRTEEALMEEVAISFGHGESHRTAHAKFIEQVVSARELLTRDPHAAMGGLLTFLTRWLVEHILGTDRRLVAEVLALKSGHPPEDAARIADEQTADVTTVLLGAMNSLFDDLATRSNEYQEANRLLKQEVEERQKAEAELERHRNHLEDLIVARTRDLAKALDDAESANRAKSAFLANMSHELRTPLNHIMGFATLLQRDITSEQGRYRLAGIEDASRRLLRMISDLLDTAKLEANQLALEAISFDLSLVLDQVARQFSETATAQGLAIVREFPRDMPRKYIGDPVRIAQILHHLVDNGIKFSTDGRIVIRVRPEGGSSNAPLIRFEVEDQGFGIPPEIRSGLFQLFHQGDNSITRAHGGIGQGLALCKRLTRLMGGEIGFDTSEGNGSTFWFTLPLALAQPLAGTQAGPDTIDWKRVHEAVRYLGRLLDEGDLQAQTLWGKNPTLFEPVLKGHMDAFREALGNFDFELAYTLLQQGISTTPELENP